MITLVSIFVVCCAIATPAPSVVVPLPFGCEDAGALVATIVPPFIINLPALISIPNVPVKVPPFIVNVPLCGWYTAGASAVSITLNVPSFIVIVVSCSFPFPLNAYQYPVKLPPFIVNLLFACTWSAAQLLVAVIAPFPLLESLIISSEPLPAAKSPLVKFKLFSVIVLPFKSSVILLPFGTEICCFVVNVMLSVNTHVLSLTLKHSLNSVSSFTSTFSPAFTMPGINSVANNK